MGMYELAHNCCYCKDGVVRYRDFENDIDARDLARELAWMLADIELSSYDDNFDEEMLENLKYDITKEPIGLIALFYRNLLAMADLRERLKEYEDFEEIFRDKMTDTACEFLKDKEEFSKWLDRNKWITKKCDEYARAEEQGLLLRLPFKVGDIIYEPISRNTINEYRVTGIKKEAFSLCIEWELEKGFIYQNIHGVEYKNIHGVEIEEIGKTVFLTKAEAEKKLKEMEND